MVICKTRAELEAAVAAVRQKKLKTGFVPTMGALHAGHCSLVDRAGKENDVVVCSVFVNPIQFNNAHDLETYPRDSEKDFSLLEQHRCDIVFAPSVGEMYAEPPTETYHFGDLEKVMEGPRRPGHFNGVAIVVNRLFRMIKPNKAYFGEKDFQQIAIIKKMVADNHIPIEIIPCPIVRDHDGLAISSRNVRLTKEQRYLAPFIHKTLESSVSLFNEGKSADEIKAWVMQEFKKEPAFEMEYYEIVDDTTLQPISKFSANRGIVGCIAVWMGDVRLIDMQRYV